MYKLFMRSSLAAIIDPGGLVKLEAKRLFGNENTRMNKDIESLRVGLLQREISNRYRVHAPDNVLSSAARTIGIRVDRFLP
jgi:hypothetical protein